MTESDATDADYDPEAVRARYLAERDKRLVPGRAAIRDLSTDEYFARYRRLLKTRADIPAHSGISDADREALRALFAGPRR